MDVRPMTVLVAAASRHGATQEIAEAIGETLQAENITVEVARLEDVATVFPYDAFVLGSAIYMGRWLRPAREFIDEHVELISARPTWLFSSGPIGSSPRSGAGESFHAADIIEITHAREHRLFAGKLDKHDLGLTERALSGALRVPGGDFRRWEDVTAWATTIAHELHSHVS
jgi:menaquinone-dependent protoporphyrinogen oxidase